MTFNDLYDHEKGKPTFAEAWVERIAKVTRKSKATVRAWICGRQIPDRLTLEILATELHTAPEELFPKLNTPKQ